MDKVIMAPALVNALFKCPLCKQILRAATVINECFHRYCKACITSYFQTDSHKTCPECQMILENPVQTLRPDLTFQRMLYKVFPREIACSSARLIATTSSDIHIDTTIHVQLTHWNIASDLFPNEPTETLAACYLECLAGTPLSAIEKLVRVKYSLPSTLKIDLFYQSLMLNADDERLIDICHCFDHSDENSSIDLRFVVTPHGYRAIRERIRQCNQPVPLQVEVTPPPAGSPLPSTSSLDSTLKVKICRSQSSANDWYIPQSTPLPDVVHSHESEPTQTKLPLKRKSPGLSKPRRRIRFIPTMVKAPPSIFDRLAHRRYGSDIFSSHALLTHPVRKSICKVSPFVVASPANEEPCFADKPPLFDCGPLDLSLK